MFGENVKGNESKLDLLIVTDEKDFLRKYAFRIIYALQHLYSDYTADIKRTFDVCIIPGQINFSCKKLVFITWGLDKCTKSRVTKWLGMATATNANDRFILTMTGDLYGNVLNTSDEKMGEINMKYQINVGHLDQLDKWWPQMVGFLFNAPVPLKTKYKCFILKKPAQDALIKCEDTVKACIEYYKVKEKDRNVYILCVLGTGLPYWRGVIITDHLCRFEIIFQHISNINVHCPYWWTHSYPYYYNYYYDTKYIVFGLFKVCLSNTFSFSADLEECSEYSLEMPAWWRIQTVLCLLAMALYFVSFVLVWCVCIYGGHWLRYACLKIKVCVAATICHLSAGVVCIVVVLMWWILSEDYITYFGFNDWGTSKPHASFYLFVAPVILQTICILLCLLRDCCKRSSFPYANIVCI